MKSCSNCKYADTLVTKKPCRDCEASGGRIRLFSMWKPKNEETADKEERKPTNYEKIMAEMTVEKMAKLIIEPITTIDGETFWHTSKGGNADYEDALKAEIEWLKSEVEE